MILGLLFLLALAALILPGEALLRWLAPGCRWGRCRPLVAFGIGQGVAMCGLWFLGMMGVPMWTWGIGIVLVVSMVALWGAWWRDRSGKDGQGGCEWVRSLKWKAAGETPAPRGSGVSPAAFDPSRRAFPFLRDPKHLRMVINGLPWLILVLATWVFMHQAVEEALKFRIGSVPGMGNWAYKTKLLMMTESWPADFFEYEGHNRRMGYPPGFPLLCGWCAAFMGGLETHAIRLLPVALMSGTFLLAGAEMIRLRRWWGVPGVVALLALFLGYPGRGILSHFYAEPLLLFTASVSMVALGRARENPYYITIALLAAGCMAWTKNEGVVGFLLIAGCLFLFANPTGSTRKAVAITASSMACVMVLPWRVYLTANGWSDESFAWVSFVGEGRWERLAAAWNEYSSTMFTHGARFGGAWWIAPLLTTSVIMRRNWIVATQCMTAVGWVAVAIVLMMGSAEEDFAWHIRAAPRVLLCPSLLLLMAYAYLGITQENQNHGTLR